MNEETTDVDAVIAGELQLMDPAVRATRSLAARLLDPEFIEVGASGRRWTYEEMLAALPEMTGADTNGPRHEPSGMTGVVLAPAWYTSPTRASSTAGGPAEVHCGAGSTARRRGGCTTTRRRPFRLRRGRGTPDVVASGRGAYRRGDMPVSQEVSKNEYLAA